MSLAAAKDGGIWVGTTAGLARIAGGEEPIVFPVSHPWIMNDARVRQIVRERCLTVC